jgi:hypothetical protein
MSYMYDISSLSAANRRISPRFPVQAAINEYIRDRPSPALAMDVSLAGLAIRKASTPRLHHAGIVGLEVELPGTNEVIWASAEPRFHAVGHRFQLSGLLFLDMARKHRRLLHDYVGERRERWRRLFGPRPIFTSRFGCLI